MPQDFSGQNLRGRSFTGQNLTEANFSCADIRSTDFTGANLQSANFSHAKAGLQRRWVIFLVLVSWVLMGLSGFSLAVSGLLVSYILSKYSDYQFVGFVAIITLIMFLVATIYLGIQIGLETATIAGVTVGATIGAITVVKFFAGAFVFAFAATFAVTGAISVLFAVNFAIAGTMAGTGAVAINIAIAITIVKTFANSKNFTTETFTVACAIAVALAFFGVYVGWLAIKGDEKHSFVRNIVIAFAAIGGTSFRSADLTDADFTSATIKSTDFRKANLTRTCFYKTKKLDRVRPSSTYLQKAQVREVLVTGFGQDKNFDRQDLRGVNLQWVNLANASLIGTDLNEANLQDANLSGAKLVQTQLDGTDLTGATLTGACIEDWGITSRTKLHGVKCEYIFMRSPTPDDPNPRRKPDNWNETFADGDFADFIKPIVDTLDLYHNSGVDPRAIAISFKQLAENHPDAELEIVAMEKRGQDKFLLRAKTADTADKSELSKEYFEIYKELKALAQQESKALISEKDSQIRRLENMVVTALERPSFYSNVEHVNNMTNNPSGISQSVSGGTMHGGMQAAQGNNNTQNQGDTTVSGDRTINTDGGNYNERTEGNYVQGNYYAAGQQSLAQAAAEIQTLLEQLEKSYPTNTTAGKMAIATQAIEYIDNDNTLAQRLLSALKAGGTQALAQFLNHPAASFVIGALDDWLKSKGEAKEL